MLSVLGISSGIYSGISFVRMIIKKPPDIEMREGPCAELIQKYDTSYSMFDGKIEIQSPFQERKQIWSSSKGFTIDDADATEEHLYGHWKVCDVLHEFGQPGNLTELISQHPFLLKVTFPVTLVRLPAKPLFADYASRTIGTNRTKIMWNARLARRLPLTFTMLGVAVACCSVAQFV